MENRTFLAIALSLLVLFAYNSLLGNKKETQSHDNITQQYDVKQDVKTPKTLPASSLPIPSAIPIEESIEFLDSPAVRIELTSRGGKIKSFYEKKFDNTYLLSDILSLDGFQEVSFKGGKVNSQEAYYEYENDEVKIGKRYSFAQDPYLLKFVLTIQNKRTTSTIGQSRLNLYTIDTSRLDNTKSPPTERTLIEYSVSTDKGIIRKNNAVQFSPKDNNNVQNKINWVGFRDRYLCTIFSPQSEAAHVLIETIDKTKLDLKLISNIDSIDPNSTFSSKIDIYVGPQDLNLLKNYQKGFEEIVSFSSIGIINVFALFIYHTLEKLHKLIPLWGLCIIIVSLAIYLLLYPLTFKSMASMKKMQILQPKIAKLREQYSNNPQKLNTEIMELYKENRVNPFGGCLPIFIQMPIFIGLYQVLWRSSFFKGSSFLWMKDLSQPDRLLTFSTELPLFGHELNLLPLIMGVLIFIQQWMSTKSNVVTDPAQASQQKMMMYMVPGMVVFFFYHLASGLTIYFIIFYSMSILTQSIMNKKFSKNVQSIK